MQTTISRTNSQTSSSTEAPTCPICEGLGFVTRDVPLDHPDFGKAFPCICQDAIIANRRYARLRALSNLDVVADKTFETFYLDLNLNEEQRAALEIAVERAQAYAENPQGWLLFQGHFGSGKTHLAVAIANYRLEQGEPVLFITVPDLLDHLRSTYGPSSEVEYDELFERVRNYPLLVLDDLGTESPTPWAQEKLYQLINHRYLHKLCTVITTNNDLQEIDARIHSRLVDRSLTVSVNLSRVPDFRRSDAAPTANDSLNNLSLYGHMTFETFDLRQNTLAQDLRKNLHEAYKIAIDYAKAPTGWLVFIGKHGCGKTHLAAAIANHRHMLGEKAVMVTAPDLLDYLRAAFDPRSGIPFAKRFQDIKTAPLLVIDHLEFSSATPWALEKIRQIVEYRYIAHLPTVFTTTQMAKDLDPMLRSRFRDERECTTWVILAPDYRGGKPPSSE